VAVKAKPVIFPYCLPNVQHEPLEVPDIVNRSENRPQHLPRHEQMPQIGAAEAV
jgi:hypothetical protein